VLNLVASKSEPVGLQQATPAIETYLFNERKLKLVADDLQALRRAAKIVYVGDFAKNRDKAHDLPTPVAEAAPRISLVPAPAGSAAVAAPQLDVAPAEVSAASMPTQGVVEKGLKGMK
jgi:hypothetical protein